MKQANKLKKVIYKLSVENGYPHQKLNFEQYSKVLKEASRRVFSSNAKPANQII